MFNFASFKIVVRFFLSFFFPFVSNLVLANSFAVSVAKEFFQKLAAVNF